MYKSVKYLTKVNNNIFSTHYLYDRTEKVILPIELTSRHFDKTPTAADTLRRILNALQIKTLGIKISTYTNGIYYSYLSILRHKQILDIYINLEDALEIAVTCDLPILVKDRILEENGVKITSELIKKTLETN